MVRFSKIWTLILVFGSYLTLAETNEEARQHYVEQFLKFNENKNVFGDKVNSTPNTPSLLGGVGQDNDLKYATVPYDSPSQGIRKFSPQSNQSQLEKAVTSLLSDSPWVQRNSTTASGSPTFREELTPSARDAVKEFSKKIFDTELSNEIPNSPISNSFLQREASARATKALWDRTLSQLTQRKVFLATRIELSDSLPTCPEAAAVSSDNSAPSRISVCEAMLEESWDTVTNVENEDPYVRDLRNQLHAIKEAGIDKSELKSNWAYDESEFKTQHGNQVSLDNVEAPLSNSDQLQTYSNSLDRAAEQMKRFHHNSSIEYGQAVAQLSNTEGTDAAPIISRAPASTHALDKFKIARRDKDIVSINQPTQAMIEDLGITPPRNPLPQTYSELLQQAQR